MQGPCPSPYAGGTRAGYKNARGLACAVRGKGSDGARAAFLGHHSRARKVRSSPPEDGRAANVLLAATGSRLRDRSASQVKGRALAAACRGEVTL